MNYCTHFYLLIRKFKNNIVYIIRCCLYYTYNMINTKYWNFAQSLLILRNKCFK